MPHIYADNKNIEHMTRKERIAFIKALKRDGQYSEALKFWLQRSRGISRKTFESL